MGDSRSFRDAFSRRKPPAPDGLGGATDKFRKPAAGTGGDAFKTTGKPSGQKQIGDAFAPQKKNTKLLRAPTAPKAKHVGLPSGSGAKLGLPKPPKVKPPPKPKPIKASKLTAAPPVRPSKMVRAKPQKMTDAKVAPVKPLQPAMTAQSQVKLTAAAPAKVASDPFGRKEAKPQRPKALVPAQSGKPLSPMTRPIAKASPSIAKPAKPLTPPVTPKASAVAPPPPVVELPPAPEAPQAEATRAQLQIVPTESALERIGLKKFRRAARSSSLVLVTGAGAEVAADETHAAPTDTYGGSTMVTASGDSDSLVKDKPPEPGGASVGNTSPATPAAPVSSSAADKTVQPAAAAPAPQAEATPSPVAEAAKPAAPPAEPVVERAPDPSPNAAAAAAAAAATATAAKPAAASGGKTVEVVEPIIEPPVETAPEPAVGVADAGPKAAAQQSAAVETSWQPVENGAAAADEPAIAVLEEVEKSRVGGFWGGATIGGKTAATRRRGFNQDDMFGLMFGLAVIAFVFFWLFRGKGAEPPAEDEIVTAQNAPQAVAALPPPAAAPVDPFGNAPVDLRPSGPIPEATPAPPPETATPQSATPPQTTAEKPAATATPATAPVVNESAVSLASTKMHAWFCTASSRLTKTSRTALTGELAKYEDVFAGKELVVRGYADTRGSTELNADLGERRAKTVANYLTKKGLSVVDVQGVGELAGLDDNQNCANQRRVDIWVKGGPAETPSRECAPEPEAEALICG